MNNKNKEYASFLCIRSSGMQSYYSAIFGGREADWVNLKVQSQSGGTKSFERKKFCLFIYISERKRMSQLQST